MIQQKNDPIQNLLQRLHFWSRETLLSSYKKVLFEPSKEFDVDIEFQRIRYKIAVNQFDSAQKEYDDN